MYDRHGYATSQQALGQARQSSKVHQGMLDLQAHRVTVAEWNAIAHFAQHQGVFQVHSNGGVERNFPSQD